jgi:hypothetical protein
MYNRRSVVGYSIFAVLIVLTLLEVNIFINPLHFATLYFAWYVYVEHLDIEKDWLKRLNPDEDPTTITSRFSMSESAGRISLLGVIILVLIVLIHLDGQKLRLLEREMIDGCPFLASNITEDNFRESQRDCVDFIEDNFRAIFEDDQDFDD